MCVLSSVSVLHTSHSSAVSKKKKEKKISHSNSGDLGTPLVLLFCCDSFIPCVSLSWRSPFHISFFYPSSHPLRSPAVKEILILFVELRTPRSDEICKKKKKLTLF